MYGQGVFWRETMRNGKFLIFEGRVVFVLLPTFIHLRFWTLITAIFTMFMFWWFERKGITANAILRYLKCRMIGKKRSARGPYEERTAVDFSFEVDIYRRNLEIEEARRKMGGRKPGLLARLGLSSSAQSSGGEVSLSKE